MGFGAPFSRAHSGPPEILMRRLVLATLAAAALAGPALAANDTPPTVAPKFESVPQDAVLSYNLIGLNITDAQNNTVGEIKDLAIVHEKLVGYIVSVGGFLGMGEHYVAVAPSSIALGYDADAKKWKAIIGATKEQLKSAPEFKYDGKFKR
ncbi:PRC-barrel domain-containing protein [Methylobacterium pseudosasicola]|uniref:PRC-barrel domain-containing protein n=2 Tax=Methylobacterium pseudosasicola TaxID=582667 RepID=A0A1I4M4R0_9HYPH|nr:PRC-barrel domain-containing protein [Methylobacterium pseudosasicola]